MTNTIHPKEDLNLRYGMGSFPLIKRKRWLTSKLQSAEEKIEKDGQKDIANRKTKHPFPKKKTKKRE